VFGFDPASASSICAPAENHNLAPRILRNGTFPARAEAASWLTPKEISMRLATLIVCAFALVAAAQQLRAQEPRPPGAGSYLDAMVGNSVLQLDYLTASPVNPTDSSSDLDYGLLLSEDRDIIGSAALLFHTNLNLAPRLTFEVGPKAYVALLNAVQKTDIAAIAFGANARYELIRRWGIAAHRAGGISLAQIHPRRRAERSRRQRGVRGLALADRLAVAGAGLSPRAGRARESSGGAALRSAAPASLDQLHHDAARARARGALEQRLIEVLTIDLERLVPVEDLNRTRDFLFTSRMHGEHRRTFAHSAREISRTAPMPLLIEQRAEVPAKPLRLALGRDQARRSRLGRRGELDTVRGEAVLHQLGTGSLGLRMTVIQGDENCGHGPSGCVSSSSGERSAARGVPKGDFPTGE
jgi:hypothetical protein